jgi:hypothetical protein
MPDIEHIRAQIERTHIQVQLRRGEIRQLQRVGIATTSAEALLDRMLSNIDGLCRARTAEKEAALTIRPSRMARRQCPHPPWIKAPAEVRRLAPREGWCCHHVRAIKIAGSRSLIRTAMLWILI